MTSQSEEHAGRFESTRRTLLELLERMEHEAQEQSEQLRGEAQQRAQETLSSARRRADELDRTLGELEAQIRRTRSTLQDF